MGTISKITQTDKDIIITVNKKWLIESFKINDDLPEIKITNKKLFISGLLEILKIEEENGADMIDKMFDEAFNIAIDNGVDGVEYKD